MTQQSKERLPETEGAPSMRSGARILPFERPQSELQRAIQQRAQEAIDVDRERDLEKRRPQPLKWLAIFALTCIPVLLTVGAIDAFVRVFHKITAAYSSAPIPPAQEQQAAPGDAQSQPGVVMLEAYSVPAEPERSATSPAASPPPPADAPSPH
jgi:hypothetical protein